MVQTPLPLGKRRHPRFTSEMYGVTGCFFYAAELSVWLQAAAAQSASGSPWTAMTVALRGPFALALCVCTGLSYSGTVLRSRWITMGDGDGLVTRLSLRRLTCTSASPSSPGSCCSTLNSSSRRRSWEIRTTYGEGSPPFALISPIVPLSLLGRCRIPACGTARRRRASLREANWLVLVSASSFSPDC